LGNFVQVDKIQAQILILCFLDDALL